MYINNRFGFRIGDNLSFFFPPCIVVDIRLLNYALVSLIFKIIFFSKMRAKIRNT